MFLDVESFFRNLYASYESLPGEAKLIVYIILILIFIVAILLIIMLEQRRLNSRVIDKKVEVSENTEVLNLDFGEFGNEIDESNEKTRNLKEITDKIQAVIDNRAIDLTKFEQEQEENSIISYDELKKSVGGPIEEPKQVDFSLPNLVRKIEVSEEIEKELPYVEQPKEEKFKASAIISPVFGVQDPNRTVIKEETPMTSKEEYVKQTITEEETFLSNLKEFRKNLE